MAANPHRAGKFIGGSLLTQARSAVDRPPAEAAFTPIRSGRHDTKPPPPHPPPQSESGNFGRKGFYWYTPQHCATLQGHSEQSLDIDNKIAAIILIISIGVLIMSFLYPLCGGGQG